jgi:hypothetical protein
MVRRRSSLNREICPKAARPVRAIPRGRPPAAAAGLDPWVDLRHVKFGIRKRLAKIRVFDPACGYGNFLVIAHKNEGEPR